MSNPSGIKIIVRNRKAYHDYFIKEDLEGGLVLTGSEVKSLRSGSASLKEAYARIEQDEVLLYGMHISPYKDQGYSGHEPLRTRKLLFHKSEIRKLRQKVEAKGATLVPVELYFRHGYAKVKLGLAFGKRQYDKRQDIAEREANREMERKLKG